MLIQLCVAHLRCHFDPIARSIVRLGPVSLIPLVDCSANSGKYFHLENIITNLNFRINELVDTILEWIEII